MGEKVAAAGVEQRGFDVVVQVFEQEVIAALDKAKVEAVGCIDHIANCNGPVVDGVRLPAGHKVFMPSSPIRLSLPSPPKRSRCCRRF